MTRITAWLAGTVGTLFLLFGYHTSTTATMQALGSTPAISGSASSGATSSGSSGSAGSGGGSGSGAGSGSGSGAGAGSGTTSGSGASAAAAQTFTGGAAVTRYGPVQVQLTVQDGSIASVSVLQYPHSDSRDQQINGYALPRLIDETIAAQDAQIDMVSGASYTSQGYVTSLQSALDQAGL